MSPRQQSGKQAGIALLEALIAILIIAFGVLGIIGLQANSVAFVNDARYRVVAAEFADRLIAEMWANSGYDPSPNPVNFPNAGAYIWDGASAAPAGITTGVSGGRGWLDDLTRSLPTNGQNPTIAIDGNGLVTITIFWAPPNSQGVVHQYRAVANIATAHQTLN